MKFRRQHQLGPYIADFYCREAGLVVEVDGETHFTPEGLAYDRARDEWMAALGLTVRRFPAHVVGGETDPVVEEIWNECRQQVLADQPDKQWVRADRLRTGDVVFFGAAQEPIRIESVERVESDELCLSGFPPFALLSFQPGVLTASLTSALLFQVHGPVLQVLDRLGVPDDVIHNPSQVVGRRPRSLLERDQADEIVTAESLVENRSNQVYVVVADLDEDAAALGEQVAGGGEAVTKVRQVAVDAEFPGVAERLDLLRLAGQVFGLRVPLAGAHLPVAAELDAVGRVEVDALHPPAEPLLLGQAGHHHQAVAQDQPVRPVLAVAVELQLLLEVVQPVEVAEQVEGARLAGGGTGLQVVDDVPRVNLLLHVDGHGRHFQRVGVVLLLPHQLRVE